MEFYWSRDKAWPYASPAVIFVWPRPRITICVDLITGRFQKWRVTNSIILDGSISGDK
jgi:hypothetical protein